jgi:hypothetical protein
MLGLVRFESAPQDCGLLGAFAAQAVVMLDELQEARVWRRRYNLPLWRARVRVCQRIPDVFDWPPSRVFLILRGGS